MYLIELKEVLYTCCSTFLRKRKKRRDNKPNPTIHYKKPKLLININIQMLLATCCTEMFISMVVKKLNLKILFSENTHLTALDGQMA